MFNDLNMRSGNGEAAFEVLDKVTFVEYTQLPGIINDRIHTQFSEQANQKGSKIHSRKYEHVTK